jgi:hypothetical protein
VSDNEKVDAAEFLTEEEAREVYFAERGQYNTNGPAFLAVASEALTRARKKWGVTGRRVEGCTVQDGSQFGLHSYVHRTLQIDCRPATLFIHEPPKPLEVCKCRGFECCGNRHLPGGNKHCPCCSDRLPTGTIIIPCGNCGVQPPKPKKSDAERIAEALAIHDAHLKGHTQAEPPDCFSKVIRILRGDGD